MLSLFLVTEFCVYNTEILICTDKNNCLKTKWCSHWPHNAILYLMKFGSKVCGSHNIFSYARFLVLDSAPLCDSISVKYSVHAGSVILITYQIWNKAENLYGKKRKTGTFRQWRGGESWLFYYPYFSLKPRLPGTDVRITMHGSAGTYAFTMSLIANVEGRPLTTRIRHGAAKTPHPLVLEKGRRAMGTFGTVKNKKEGWLVLSVVGRLNI